MSLKHFVTALVLLEVFLAQAHAAEAVAGPRGDLDSMMDLLRSQKWDREDYVTAERLVPLCIQCVQNKYDNGKIGLERSYWDKMYRTPIGPRNIYYIRLFTLCVPCYDEHIADVGPTQSLNRRTNGKALPPTLSLSASAPSDGEDAEHHTASSPTPAVLPTRGKGDRSTASAPGPSSSPIRGKGIRGTASAPGPAGAPMGRKEGRGSASVPVGSPSVGKVVDHGVASAPTATTISNKNDQVYQANSPATITASVSERDGNTVQPTTPSATTSNNTPTKDDKIAQQPTSSATPAKTPMRDEKLIKQATPSATIINAPTKEISTPSATPVSTPIENDKVVQQATPSATPVGTPTNDNKSAQATPSATPANTKVEVNKVTQLPTRPAASTNIENNEHDHPPEPVKTTASSSL